MYGEPDLDDPGPSTPYGAGSAVEFFNDDDDYIAIPHHEAFELTNGTIQFWLNTDRTHGIQGILSKDHAGYGDGGHLGIWLDGDQLVVRLQSTEESYYVVSNVPIDKHEWHYVVFTFGEGGMNLYLDAMLVGSNLYNGGIENNTEPWVIGGLLIHTNSRTGDLEFLDVDRSFNKHIDEFAMFNMVFDQEEIMRLMIKGPYRAEFNTYSYYLFISSGCTDGDVFAGVRIRSNGDIGVMVSVAKYTLQSSAATRATACTPWRADKKKFAGYVFDLTFCFRQIRIFVMCRKLLPEKGVNVARTRSGSNSHER